MGTLEQSCENVVEQSCGNLALGNLGGTLWVKVVGALWNKVVGTQSCGNLGNLGGTLWGKVAQQTGRCLVVAWLRGFVFYLVIGLIELTSGHSSYTPASAWLRSSTLY